MKVILLQNVPGLGTQGDLVEVADGYGRNYLIPRGLAEQATKGNVKSLEMRREALKKRAQREEAQARELASRLEALTVTIRAKAGESGRLFGSVTTSDIVQALQESAGIELDRRKIELEEPIKALGRYQVPVKLYPGVVATLPVEVVSQEGDGSQE